MTNKPFVGVSCLLVRTMKVSPVAEKHERKTWTQQVLSAVASEVLVDKQWKKCPTVKRCFHWLNRKTLKGKGAFVRNGVLLSHRSKTIPWIYKQVAVKYTFISIDKKQFIYKNEEERVAPSGHSKLRLAPTKKKNAFFGPYPLVCSLELRPDGGSVWSGASAAEEPSLCAFWRDPMGSGGSTSLSCSSLPSTTLFQHWA